MRLAVVIATTGPSAALGRLLGQFQEQDRPPDEVVASAPHDTKLPEVQIANYPISYVYRAIGGAEQRNSGLQAVFDRSDVVTFFGADFLPAKNYLSRLAMCFEAFGDVVAIMGRVAVDGARGSGLTFDEGMMALRAAEASSSDLAEWVVDPGTYGCNISLRTSLMGALRFDERLVAYGWQDEIDFTGQLHRCGRIVGVPALLGVRLGSEPRRTNGVKVGYSQMVDPTYQTRKGTIATSHAASLMARSVASNFMKSLYATPYPDYRARLKGNLIGAYHLALGRVEPEHGLKL